MSMTGAGMGNSILGKINALSDDDKKVQAKIMQAMGEGIVEYIQANATVSQSIIVPSAGTAMANAGGPVTGTIAVTQAPVS